MSYWNKLDESRRRLTAGDFLEAEKLYFAAADGHSRSRLRAPLMEKGVEPLLRWGRKVAGKEPGAPRPEFPVRAAELRKDLDDVAALHLRAARGFTESQTPLDPEGVARLAQALRFQLESQIFVLDEALLWAALSAYLEGAQHCELSVAARLLPPTEDFGRAERAWLSAWIERRLDRRAADLQALAPWFVEALRPLCRNDSEPLQGQVCAVVARLHLLDPHGAPRALAAAQAASEAASPPHDPAGVLDLVASLAANERRLATPLSTPRLLDDLAPLAAVHGVPWPPARLEALLRARDTDEPDSVLVAVGWEGEPGERVVLVKHRGAAPLDVLLLRPSEDAATSDDPFACSMTEALARVDAWLDAEAPVLLAEEPPQWLATLLGHRPRVSLGDLEKVLSLDEAVGSPVPPNCFHPTLEPVDDPLADSWRPLVGRALELVPRLAVLARRPALGSQWGLRNMAALGRAGMTIPRHLGVALSRLAPPGSRETRYELLEGTVRMEWPRLEERPWPARRHPVIPAERREADLIIHGRPSPGELAGWALATAPSVLLCGTAEEGGWLAAGLAGEIDPLTVTLAPAAARCPEPAFALLDGWIEESLVQEGRSLDVLWLYHAVASAPEGDLVRWLEQGGGDEARELALERIAQGVGACGPSCRLARHAECFAEQLQERRRRSAVWIEWSEHLAFTDGAMSPDTTVVCGDLVDMVSNLDDDAAGIRLTGLMGRAASARALVQWSDSAPFADAVTRELSKRLPERRAFRSLLADDVRPLHFHMSPPGYAPGALLLADEARALIRARVGAWSRRQVSTRAWIPEGLDEDWRAVGGPKPLRGSRAAAAEDAVVATMLGRPGPLDPALALLRLSAAATCARRELACVDPRLSGMFGDAWAVAAHASILTDPSPATGGAAILDRIPARQVPHWRAPVDRGRLERMATRLVGGWAVDETRRAALADALGGVERGGRLVLTGVRRDESVLLAATLARLGRESGDGGPLTAATTVWVGSAFPQEAFDTDLRILDARRVGLGTEQLGERLAEGIDLLVLDPRDLVEPEIVEWAQGASVAWIVAEADRASARNPGFDPHMLEFQRLLAAHHPGAGGLVLACLADDDRRPGSGASEWAESLDASAVMVGKAPALAAWRWRRVRLEDPAWTCPQCGESDVLVHAYRLCGRCGSTLLEGPERHRVERELVAARVRWLARQGMEARWVVLCESLAMAAALRRGLGIEAASASTPLLESSQGLYSVEIVELSRLFDATPPEGELLLASIPDDPSTLRSTLSHLVAHGRLSGSVHLMDHPLLWDEPGDDTGSPTQPALDLEQLVWRAGRAEVEFRLQQALTKLGRARRSESPHAGSRAPGLGPRTEDGEAGMLALLGMAFPAGDEAEAVASAGGGVTAVSRLGGVLKSLEDAGLSFGNDGVPGIDLNRLGDDPAQRSRRLHLLQWLAAEGLAGPIGGLAVAIDPPAVPSLRTGSEKERHWLQSARTIPTGIDVELSPWPPHDIATTKRPESEGDASGASGWILGVAGSRRSTRLAERVAGMVGEGGGRPLLITASSIGLLRWEALLRAQGLRPGAVETVGLRELVMAFLRAHHRLGGFTTAPRVLSSEATPEGEELRDRLLRETSRRYAATAGGSPPIDLVQLRRLLETGESLSAAAVAGVEERGLDLPLLRQCAAEVRKQGGWILPAELGELSRRWLVEHPYVGEAWRDRYPRVLVDDLDAMPPAERAFLERLFGETHRSSVADPGLLPVGHSHRGDGGERKSLRLPREIARASEALLRDDLLGSGSIKARGREKGRLDRRHVLNLEACVSRIEEALSGRDWQRQRVGIILAYGGDVPRLASRLREIEIAVWSAQQVLEACAPGPREFLMALVLAGHRDGLDPIVAGSLATELLYSAGVEAPPGGSELLGQRVRELFAGQESRPHEPADAYLLSLVQVAEFLEGTEELREAAELLARTRLLQRLAVDGAAASRWRDYVRPRADMPWRAVIRGIDPAGLVDPLAPGPRVWLLEIEDLPSLELDRAFYLCTGHEPPEVHYRVLGRIRESLTVLYSEADPFAARR